jgi:L-threonylcarbamoyladenylate synthase
MSDVRTIDEDSLALAAKIVSEGGLVVLPTDTVYGVAANPFSAEAVNGIYAAKRRPRGKALQVLLSSVDDLDELGLYLPDVLLRLSKAFLPGPFSPIAVARQDSRLVTLRKEDAGGRTQAVRVPDARACLKTLRVTGPLACSSANRSGGKSPQTVEEAVAALGDEVDLYLDGGPTSSHVASTVVAADANEPNGIRIIREGVIDEARLLRSLTNSENRGVKE